MHPFLCSWYVLFLALTSHSQDDPLLPVELSHWQLPFTIQWTKPLHQLQWWQNCSKYFFQMVTSVSIWVICVHSHRCSILTFSKYFSPLVYLLVFITYWYSIHSQGIQSWWCLFVYMFMERWLGSFFFIVSKFYYIILFAIGINRVLVLG